MTANRSEEVGRLIRNLRLQSEMTQDDLARAVGCSKAQLSLMESGQRSVTPDRAAALEQALSIHDGRILAALHWQNVPAALRAQIEQAQAQANVQASRIKHALQSEDPVAALRRVIEQTSSNIDLPLPLRRQIPVINKLAAGYPAEFTDLDYPASVADEYIACPDVTDPDAFAARVVGDSMEPAYREGDIVVFSPQAPTPAGCDCFVRLERDNETTFKRIYFENDERTIRLQPLNNAYPPRFVDREDVAGLYAAVYVMRRVGAAG